MRFLINALSVTNASGRHVLLGHLQGLAARTAGRHEFVVLWHSGNRDLVRDLGSNVRWRECPGVCRNWVGRVLWEAFFLKKVCAGEGIEAAFSPAGLAMPVGKLPQIVFCQNPWALVRGLSRSPLEEVKAVLQRRGYREAVKRAAVMVFNSRFMEEIYIENAGGLLPKRSVIAYQGVDPDAFEAAERGEVARVPNQILSVSAMAPHKDVGTLIKALAFLRDRHKVVARLKLVGAWPVPAYRLAMERLIDSLGLGTQVELCGHVSREELLRLYASSMVFALFSRCESFGIPAVEAQAFGTPVVCADCCAAREIEGKGGLFVAPGDVAAAAKALHSMLTDRLLHQDLGTKARVNAERFRWEACTEGLLPAFDAVANGISLVTSE